MKKIIEIFSQYRGLSKSAYVIFFGRMITNMGAFIWPLLTLIMKDKMGYSPSTIAYIFLAVGALFLPANIIGGKLADKFNKKKLIIIFDCISIFFFILCAFFEPGNWMMAFFILAGLFANMEGPAFEALVMEVTKPKERERVYSLMYLGHNLGFMFGAAIGGLLFANFLSLAFILDGITTLLSTILIIMFVKVINTDELGAQEKNEYEEKIEHGTKVGTILKGRPSILIQLIVFFFGAFIYDQWNFVLPMYMTDLFGRDLGSKYFGFLSSFNAFVVIVFTPLITYVVNKFHELPKVFIGQFLIGASFLIIINQPAYYIFFIMMFFFTVGEIVNMLGSSPFMSRRVPASHRGRVNSFRHISYFVGSALGRVIMGWILEATDYSVTFAAIATLGIMTTGIVGYNYFLDKRIFPKLYEKKVSSGNNGISLEEYDV